MLKQEIEIYNSIDTVYGKFAIRQAIKIFYCRMNYCSCQ